MDASDDKYLFIHTKQNPFNVLLPSKSLNKKQENDTISIVNVSRPVPSSTALPTFISLRCDKLTSLSLKGALSNTVCTIPLTPIGAGGVYSWPYQDSLTYYLPNNCTNLTFSLFGSDDKLVDLNTNSNLTDYIYITLYMDYN